MLACHPHHLASVNGEHWLEIGELPLSEGDASSLTFFLKSHSEPKVKKQFPPALYFHTTTLYITISFTLDFIFV